MEIWSNETREMRDAVCSPEILHTIPMKRGHAFFLMSHVIIEYFSCDFFQIGTINAHKRLCIQA